MRPTEYRAQLRRFLALTLLALGPLASPAFSSPLFDDDSVIEIRLSGPLRTLARDKKRAERVEFPFLLSVNGLDIPVDIRVRGKSRITACGFPPLRLRFPVEGTSQTVFAGQDKLKLVTHCKSNRQASENNLLEEYLAYRIFNLIADAGYRVRLLRIQYEDTDGGLKHLDRPYYGFLIESDRELAARVNGDVSTISGVPYSRLNDNQTALVYVFQYLIGNTDWSLIRGDGEDVCCHNVHLIEKNGGLYPIPYDFDFSGLVNARYAKPNTVIGTNRVTQRTYRGYCKLPMDRIATALETITARREPILSLAEQSPVVGNEDTDSRVRYIDHFFEEAENSAKLLKQFDADCVGPR
jgi:hypothetical protein